MKKISLAYFGTPDFSADFLKMILDDSSLPVEIKLVVTQPDQILGRKKIVTPTPVKQLAMKYGLSTFDGQWLMDNGQKKSSTISHLPSTIKSLNVDLVLLFAYGKIIKEDLLEAPQYGFWNIHPSLLPKYRGTSPMTYPLILGDNVTGVTLMKMDVQMDHGPIIAQQELNIDPDDRNPDLQQKSIKVAIELFKKALNTLALQPSNSLTMTEQNHSQATYTRFQTKDDGYIPISVLKKAMNGEELTEEEMPNIVKEYYEKNKDSGVANAPQNEVILANEVRPESAAKVIYNLFRGLYPWPGIWTKINIISNEEKRLKITDVKLINNKLVIKKIQLEGKNSMSYSDFIRHYSL